MITYMYIQVTEWALLALSLVFIVLRVFLSRPKTPMLSEILLLFGISFALAGVICDIITYPYGGFEGKYYMK